MPLTDTAIRTAKPAAKPVKLYDDRGMFLLIAPAGGKWWRFRYRFDGKHKTLSMGVYPDVTLKDARVRRDEARRLLANGIDPGVHRKAAKSARAESAANSFEVVAREWFAKYSATWAEHHANRIIRRFERDVFPHIGGRPIAEINALPCWPWYARSRHEARLKRLTVCLATADRSSAMPWRPDALNATHPVTCAVRRPLSKANTSRQSLTRSAQGNCCA
jgi:hypothetical protein